MSIFLLVGAAVYGYFEYTKLAMAQEAIAQEEQQLTELTDKQTKFQDEYRNSNSAYQTEFQTINAQIEDVFPLNENYTDLTMKLDKSVNDLSRPNNPIVMSNLDFTRPSEGDGDYMVLPFNLTLNTTRSNFEEFMRYVQNSGELQEGTRLMDIKSLGINFSGFMETAEGEAPINEPMQNVNLSLNAYFQKPAAGTATIN